MSDQVILRVISGPIVGEEFAFDSHDTFLFGRHSDCHASLAEDGFASRHHFILETNPPAVRLRDLGSLNGTLVNDVKTGGRTGAQRPDPARRGQHPHVDLQDGDRVRVGDTEFQVEIRLAPRCRNCLAAFEGDGGAVEAADLCDRCQETNHEETLHWQPSAQQFRCERCGTEVTRPAAQQSSKESLCSACRQRMANDQDQLQTLLHDRDRLKARSESRQVGDYRLERELGRGGMGAVYLARHSSDRNGKEPVAVKLLLAGGNVEQLARQRFEREAEICMRLEHPRIVRVLEQGMAGNNFYFVMEYCSGGSLDGLLSKYTRRMPQAKAIRLMIRCLEGMQFAHHRKLVHRDLKPANILLQRDARGRYHPKIADFGLAKSFQLAGLSGMTATGSFGGSWYYMPREQLTNFKFVEPVSDVWSLGATFYQVLTGRHARDFPPERDPIEVVLQEDARPIQQCDPTIPKALALIVDKSLETDIGRRYEDAGKMLAAVQQLV
jgi:hypothetical protein